MNEKLRAGMLKATQLVRGGGLLEATALIQRLLRGAGAADAALAAPNRSASSPPGGGFRVIDVEPLAPRNAEIVLGDLALPQRSNASVHADWRRPPRPPQPTPIPAEETPARFLAGSYTNHAGTRAYKLFIPASYHGQALPLVVMLHGCTQDPDDFAAGTQMNELAEEYQCLVVYPAQASAANKSACWNWFKKAHQQRDGGEPSIIAGITRQIIGTYAVDPRRVYVAGLSAGGAMAAIMGMTYPDLYAAMAIHSGLPYAVAHDIPSAFAAMKHGANYDETRDGAVQKHGSAVPAIVFHGDRDNTVHPRNGDGVIAQWTAMRAREPHAEAAATPPPTIELSQVADGYAYTRTIHHGTDGPAIFEQWVIHGAGHAWSGGDSSGSYTDPKGPDAGREMLRFFYQHLRPQLAS
jgi:poly(hydroxyalkanoate) depolymerase family esterase